MTELYLRGTGRIYGEGFILGMLIGLHNWGRIFRGYIIGDVYSGGLIYGRRIYRVLRYVEYIQDKVSKNKENVRLDVCTSFSQGKATTTFCD